MANQEKRRIAPLMVLVMAGLCPLASLHCSSDSGAGTNGDEGPVCPQEQDGESRCEGDVLQRCHTGHWRSWENCAATGGACVENSSDAGTSASCVPTDAGLAGDSGAPDGGADGGADN